MGERTDQIEREIEQERGELGRNLEELEHRVKDATNWRTQFDRHPMPLLAVAFGTGWLLSAATTRKRTRNVSEYQKEREPGTWDHLKMALIAAGAAEFRQLMRAFISSFLARPRPSEATVTALPSSERPAA